MLEPEIIQNEEEIPLSEHEKLEEKAIRELKDAIDANRLPALLCEAKEKNPNYFSVIHGNQKFCDIFGVALHNLVGKNYDFLFADFDVDSFSDDYLEYVRLMKSVKDFKPCSVILTITTHKEDAEQIRFKVTFSPSDFTEERTHHCIFLFEKVEQEKRDLLEGKASGKENSILLKNLERTLRTERLLREVGALIISNLSIQDIARSIAKILCEHLRADRCLIHDYESAHSNFVVEYHDSYTAEMFKGDDENLRMLTDYISFQNHFYEKSENKEKKNGVFIIEDMLSDPSFSPIAGICEKFSIAAQVAVTTTFNGEVNGGIYIHQTSKRTWLADEIELIDMIAEQFSIALDRAKSVDRVMAANHALMEKTAQLKESLDHEQEMRKMQNEFVALVSHEFKTPLQIIDSTRELLTRKLKNLNVVDESVDKSLERIKGGIQRMNGLIQSTLNLARMEAGDGKIKLEIQTFDLKKFILDIIEKNSNLAQNKNIKIHTRIDDLPSDFHGDPKLLDHSITNVISNAIKYSKNDTVVKIFAKATDKQIGLRVMDQGIGIPKEDLANIGQKFFRAKNTLAVAGTGIGVYLTKHFIEMHGGTVQIESELNVGTSVTVILPRNL